MKKQYSKPEIMFESFTLSVNIAGDCDVITTTMAQNVCGYLDPRDPTGTMVFNSSISGCQRIENDENSTICYHNPTPTSNIFNS